MRRRDFITGIAGSAAASPLAARAQQSAMPVIGVLGIRTPTELAHLVSAFHQGLREAGYSEGLNVEIQYRWAENHPDRLPTLARELADRRVAVIAATGGGVSALAAKAATATIPIVFVVADLDPVAFGLVARLNRPGANITGIAPFTSVLTSKRLQFLHQMVPSVTAFGCLANPNNPTSELQIREVRAAAHTLGIQLHVVSASNENDFGAAFAALLEQRVGALILGADPLFLTRRKPLIALAARHSMPVVYFFREFAADGGLLSYAPSLKDGYRLGGIYVGKILKGEKPADLPVMQPTKFELVINLKTAKALNLQIPATLLALADEVIE